MSVYQHMQLQVLAVQLVTYVLHGECRWLTSSYCWVLHQTLRLHGMVGVCTWPCLYNIPLTLWYNTRRFSPLIPALCSMLMPTYYAQSYACIICAPLNLGQPTRIQIRIWITTIYTTHWSRFNLDGVLCKRGYTGVFPGQCVRAYCILTNGLVL